MKLPKVTSETIEKITRWKELVKKNGVHHPFVKVSDVKKMGRRHLHFCQKQKRVVHLLSDGEKRTYEMLIWLPSTLQINEQMPLDLNATLRISADLGYMHPRDWKLNEAHVMSTDFLVLSVDPATEQKYQTAYSFKYSNQLFKKLNGELVRRNKRTWEKLAIEAEYWREKGVQYRILTELHATKAIGINIAWFKTECNTHVPDEELKSFSMHFIESYKTDRRLTIEQHLHVICAHLQITFQRAQSIFKFAALNRILPLNLSKKLMLHTPVEMEM